MTSFDLFRFARDKLKEPSKKHRRDAGMFKASEHHHLHIASETGDTEAVQAGCPRKLVLPDVTPLKGSHKIHCFSSSDPVSTGGNSAWRGRHCGCNHCFNERHQDCIHDDVTGGPPSVTSQVLSNISSRRKSRARLLKDLARALTVDDVVAVNLDEDDSNLLAGNLPFGLFQIRTRPCKCRVEFTLHGDVFKKGTLALDGVFLEEVEDPLDYKFCLPDEALAHTTTKLETVVRIRVELESCDREGMFKLSEGAADAMVDVIRQWQPLHDMPRRPLC